MVSWEPALVAVTGADEGAIAGQARFFRRESGKRVTVSASAVLLRDQGEKVGVLQ